MSRPRVIAVSLLLWCWLGSRYLAACPFCPALSPTLAQQREDAAVCLLAEVRESSPDAASKTTSQTLLVQQCYKGAESNAPATRLTIPTTRVLPPGELCLLFGQGTAAERTWTSVTVNEASIGYFVRAPQPRQPSKDRLQYFARYLEHGEPLIAADALMEFAHADLAQVREVVAAFDAATVRQWLDDPQVRAAHKGFYGLVLGLLASAGHDAAANRALLEKLAFQPALDYRAGQDGIFAGYMLAGGATALGELRQRVLEREDASPGDSKHAVTALRFCHEFGPAELRTDIAAAMALLAQRPVTAAAAIVDLGRWQTWSALPSVLAMYRHPQTDVVIRRAVIGYLRSCPLPAAQQALAELRRGDAVGVAGAEATLDRLIGKE